MIPEERAETIIHDFPLGTFPEWVNQRLFVLIVVNIRWAEQAARASERERCASVADQGNGFVIAQLIRALPD